MPESEKSSPKSVALAVQQHKNTRKRWKMKAPEKGEKWKLPRKVKNETLKGKKKQEFLSFNSKKIKNSVLITLKI